MVVVLLGSGRLQAEDIGCVSTTFRVLGANDKICVSAFDDPKVPGVTCHLSQARTGGMKGTLGVAEDPSRFALACRQVGPITVTGDGPLVVREKIHPASPMMLDQALYEMELVGHDFYLFVDKENDRPSVVYRRRGYDYGVIALDVT